MNPASLAATLWRCAGGHPGALDQLRFHHDDAQLPSVFQVGALASASIAAQALAAAALWRLRGGHAQQIDIDQRHALAMFRSERYLRLDGAPPPEPWSPLSGYYQAGDGRWIQLHTNFPHHRDGVLRVLACGAERAEVAAAIARWNAADLDARLAAAGMCAAMIRTPEEWQATAQARAIATLPLFSVDSAGQAPPEPLRGGVADRPLARVRVLDLSRVIAAPVAARTLAQHGAEVLAISAAHLPNLPGLIMDTGRGKRNAQLDLRTDAGRATLRALVTDADVILHAYRPGALAALGFDSAALQALRPGLVEVSLCAYGAAGPWQARRGYDSLVQSASGIAWEEGAAAHLPQPGKLPCQALDHATGYIGALAAMAGLARRVTQGGGWKAQVSLAQTGRWLQSLPRLEDGLQYEDMSAADAAPWMETVQASYGAVSAVAPVERMAATPPRFERPPAPLDAGAARWS
ncbi:CoA transferase [Oxalobacteraceae bacterium A2-2]